LSKSVETGQALLIRKHTEQGKSYLRFMVKGFQDFFSASAISSGVGLDQLPNMKALLTENWWVQMLDMLAEAWPHNYVKLMEMKIETNEASDGNTFLHLAASVGHLHIFRLLRLFSDANQAVLFKTRQGDLQTPLHVAAEKGHLMVCRLILEQKAPVDVKDAKDRLPLHLALQRGQSRTGKFLLDELEQVQRAGSHPRRDLKKQHSKRAMAQSPIEKLACRLTADSGAAAPMSEEEFKAAIPETFVEMGYFGEQDKADKVRQMAALMSIYWVSSKRYDLFTRGQAPEVRLTTASWSHWMDWVDQAVVLTPKRVAALLVYCAIAGVGKIKSIRSEFASDATEPTQALASIVQNHPTLLPSFQCLEEEEQQMIIYCLKANFNFGQFLQGENLPVNLVIAKEILANEETRNTMSFFLTFVFASLCAVFGFKGLEGAIFMTEEQYSNFRDGLEALFSLNSLDALTVYNNYLARRAQLAGLDFVEYNKEHKALCRLACLTRVFDQAEGKIVESEFKSLKPQERAELTRFLVEDGCSRRGTVLFHLPNVMQNASLNPAITLAQAMRQLIKMYELAEVAFPSTPGEMGVNTVMVEAMANHAKSCKDPEIFDCTNFELVANADNTGKIVLSPWQIVTDPDVLQRLRVECDSLLSEVQLRSIRENAFAARVSAGAIFPEFRYFNDDNDPAVAELQKQAKCAMLSVFWTMSDQYEAFTRSQLVSEQLSEASWQDLRSWLDPMVEDLDTVMIICTSILVSAVCQIPKFRKQLAPGISEHSEIIRHVLENCPKVLPSYTRLEEGPRQLLRACLEHDFNLERFFSAESPPACLSVLLELMKSQQGQQDASHCLFISLASSVMKLAGSMGDKSQEGSLYMTQSRFLKLKVGLDCIAKMDTEGLSEKEACDLPFEASDPDSIAAARLACLTDMTDGTTVASCLRVLTSEDHEVMVRHLTADGMTQRPAVALFDAPAFLQKSAANPEILGSVSGEFFFFIVCWFCWVLFKVNFIFYCCWFCCCCCFVLLLFVCLLFVFYTLSNWKDWPVAGRAHSPQGLLVLLLRRRFLFVCYCYVVGSVASCRCLVYFCMFRSHPQQLQKKQQQKKQKS
ncbi:unnamed protein product, partial [Polarella glacialis]